MIDKQPIILVVDDQSQNLQIVGKILGDEDYRMCFAKSGKQALDVIRGMPVDLILLDVMMPDMDGFELCKRIKGEPGYQDIPIIFLTGLDEPEDIISGFKSGGIDYVVKPFNPNELLARVETHIKLVEANKRLKELNNQKSELLGIAAHDLKNPLAAIRSMAEVLIMTRAEDPPFRITDEERVQLYNDIQISSKNTLEIISGILNIQTIESGTVSLNITKTPIREIIFQIMDLNQFHAATKKIRIHFELEDDFDINVDIPRFREIIDNILSNAVKYSPKGKNIYITVEQDEERSINRISIRDEGPGFTNDDLEKAFEKFKKLSAKPTAGEFSSGLGLSIVKQLVELHSGTVEIKSGGTNGSSNGSGATFVIELPMNPELPTKKKKSS